MEDQASYGDIMTNADKVEDKIKELTSLTSYLTAAAENKSNAICEYDRQIAITTLKLKNGVIKEWEGQEIDKLPVTLIPIVAKGICFKFSFDREMYDSMYKGIITQIEAVKAQLNGFQSLLKIMQ